MARRERPPVERAARDLCRFRGLPEDSHCEGAPMWHGMVAEVLVVLAAALPPDDLRCLVPGYPEYPHLHDPKRKSDG